MIDPDTMTTNARRAAITTAHMRPTHATDTVIPIPHLPLLRARDTLSEGQPTAISLHRRPRLCAHPKVTSRSTRSTLQHHVFRLPRRNPTPAREGVTMLGATGVGQEAVAGAASPHEVAEAGQRMTAPS